MPVTGSKHRRSDEQHCPFCHALLLPGTSRCWLCEAKAHSVAADDAAAPPAASQVGRPERVGSYSLASLMMFMTLVCIVLGVSTLWPGVGLPLGAIVLVVWVRTSAVTRRRLERGLSVSRGKNAIVLGVVRRRGGPDRRDLLGRLRGIRRGMFRRLGRFPTI